MSHVGSDVDLDIKLKQMVEHQQMIIVCLELSETSLDSHRGFVEASLPCKVKINCSSST